MDQQCRTVLVLVWAVDAMGMSRIVQVLSFKKRIIVNFDLLFLTSSVSCSS